jgi:hypothetical protein
VTVAVSKTVIEGSTPSSGATRGWTNPAKSPRSDRGVSGFESLAAHQVCVACRIGRGVWLQSRSYAVRVRGGAPRRARATGSPPRPKRDVAQAHQGSSPWLSANFIEGAAGGRRLALNTRDAARHAVRSRRPLPGSETLGNWQPSRLEAGRTARTCGFESRRLRQLSKSPTSSANPSHVLVFAEFESRNFSNVSRSDVRNSHFP